MTRRLNISAARARLPELARYVARQPRGVVLLEHRDLDERIALTSERYLRYLEGMAGELKKQATRRFRLAGSMRSSLSDEELEAALRRLREEQRVDMEQRLRELAS